MNMEKGCTPIQIAIKVAHDKLRPNIDESMPLSLSVLIKKCWEDDAKLRPEFSEILETLLDQVKKDFEE